MQHIRAKSRQQYEFVSLDDFIEQNHAVRFIDAFVEKLELNKLGFKLNTIKSEGRPSFQTSLFLKIYIYGYLNGIRSSRKLEKECVRNIELQWLCGSLKPNYHSIADFRKINPTALRNTFKLFVLFLKEADLIGSEIIAVDGTKSRAHNSKKNNYNPKKIERHLAYIEEKTNEYLAQLDATDATEKSDKITNIEEKLKRLKEHKIKYETIATQIQQSGEPQVSTTDPDSRALLIHGQVVEVSYNTQAAVDEKHKLVVATQTLNRNDRNALSNIALEAKNNIQAGSFTLLADKGYNNAKEIETCQNQGLTTIVAQQKIVNSNDKGTTKDYLAINFIYNKATDTYTCPQGQTLKTTGTLHTKKRSSSSHKFKKYRTTACKTCPVLSLCTAKADGKREIERGQYAEALEANNKNYKEQYALYRKRQEINEHIFGTIKRVWGYYYTNLKGLKKVNGEWSLIMTVYNMKRTLNILGFDKLMERLHAWKPEYKKNWLYQHSTNKKQALIRILFFETQIAA
jgi:transposase